jgi:hypothetical protein
MNCEQKQTSVFLKGSLIWLVGLIASAYVVFFVPFVSRLDIDIYLLFFLYVWDVAGPIVVFVIAINADDSPTSPPPDDREPVPVPDGDLSSLRNCQPRGNLCRT